ncbi:hypothetical protein DPEC_G00112250 [Dallia pectoralis]|uniref:Uncharacterized protein n=1 Tax=Dallia pectoralis TaxID=75939 RepID=A0ACC2GU42_DALPE|nr:hypothetical protein DPEC_G00112250 [Dallia pectoralis]
MVVLDILDVLAFNQVMMGIEVNPGRKQGRIPQHETIPARDGTRRCEDYREAGCDALLELRSNAQQISGPAWAAGPDVVLQQQVASCHLATDGMGLWMPYGARRHRGCYRFALWLFSLTWHRHSKCVELTETDVGRTVKTQRRKNTLKCQSSQSSGLFSSVPVLFFMQRMASQAL